MNNKINIMTLTLAIALASGVTHGSDTATLNASGSVAEMGFKLPVSALNNCLDLQQGKLPQKASHPIPNGKYLITLDPGNTHYCPADIFNGCPVPKVTIYVTSDENPRGWFNQVEADKPIVLDVKGFGMDANTVYAFYTDIHCADNTGGGILGFTPAPATFALQVAKTGSGNVVSTPTGIACGEDCNEDVVSGSAVTLTASAESGQAFTGWEGACSGTANTCTVTMNAAKNVSANFGTLPVPAGLTVPDAPKVMAQMAGPGSAGVGFAAPLNNGGSPVIDYALNCSAINASGSANGTKSPLTVINLVPGLAYSCSVTARNSVGVSAPSAAVSITPMATTTYHLLTVATSGVGTVTTTPTGIDCGNTCSAIYAVKTVVTLKAVPGLNKKFSGWNGACTGTALTCSVTMEGARSVGARFEDIIIAPPALTSIKPGVGSATLVFSASVSKVDGYIATCTAANQAAQTVTGTASPLTMQNLSPGVVYSCTVIAKSGTLRSVPSKALTVTPLAPKFALTVSTSGVGSVKSAPLGIDCGKTCTASYTAATKVTLTAVPGKNKKLAAWGGACTGAAATCSVTMDAAQTVSASFENSVTAPGKPQLDSVTAGVKSATLKFVANAQNADGYTATCKAAGQPTQTTTGKASPLTVTGLTAGVVYECSLAANNSVGTTVDSKSIKVTPLAK